MTSEDPKGGISPNHIPPFNGNPKSFDDWAEDFQATMVLQNISRVFEEDPPVVPPPANPANLTAAEKERAADAAKWAVEDRQGFASLIKALKPAQRSDIKRLRGTPGAAKQAWSMLKRRYAIDQASAKHTIHNKLHNLKQARGECMESFLNKANRIWDEAHSLGTGLTEELFVLSVIHAINPEWPHVRRELEQKTDWTKEEVWEKLRNEESRRRERRISDEKFSTPRASYPPRGPRGDGRGPRDLAPALLTSGTVEERLESALEVIQHLEKKGQRGVKRATWKDGQAPKKKGKPYWQGKGDKTASSKGSSKQSRRSVKCFRFGKEGHIKANCKEAPDAL
jgi:hypothetical protein